MAKFRVDVNLSGAGGIEQLDKFRGDRRRGLPYISQMSSAFYVLIGLAMLATLGVLATGIASMIRGGEFDRRNSNKLMRLRILFQALAVALIALFMMFGGK